MATPEGRIKSEINKLLKKHNCWVHMPVKSQYGKKSIDYLVCAYGDFLGIEAKAPRKEPTELQKDIMEEINTAGGTTMVVDGPEGLASLEKWLRVREICSN